MTYLNPLPVAVLVQPVDDGVLLIRRGESGRGYGELALPGGFIERGETWQHACARELFEEANVSISPESIESFQVRSTPDGFLIVVGRAPRLLSSDLPPFAPTNETLERVIVRAPTSLAFSMHEEVLSAVLTSLEAQSMLRLEVDHMTVRLAVPTHEVSPKREVPSFSATPRSPQVRRQGSISTLSFAPLRSGLVEKNGMAGALEVSVRRLRGVDSVESAAAFFKLETGIALDPARLKTTEVQAGLALTIDLGEEGWAPGNTYTFIISTDRNETLFFAPTHWLAFDWFSLVIERGSTVRSP